MATAEAHGITDTKLIWTAFRKAMSLLAPKMLELNSLMQTICAEEKKSTYSWVMPDGLEASVINTKTAESHILWVDQHGKTHTMKYEFKVADRANITALAPRVIQSIDAYMLREVVREAKANEIDIATVHDAFFVHPNDIELVQSAYRKVAAKVLDMDLLGYILKQITGKTYNIQKGGNAKSSDVLNSKYALYH
jgi:DNA-directed RNA polymerase